MNLTEFGGDGSDWRCDGNVEPISRFIFGNGVDGGRGRDGSDSDIVDTDFCSLIVSSSGTRSSGQTPRGGEDGHDWIGGSRAGGGERGRRTSLSGSGEIVGVDEGRGRHIAFWPISISGSNWHTSRIVAKYNSGRAFASGPNGSAVSVGALDVWTSGIWNVNANFG